MRQNIPPINISPSGLISFKTCEYKYAREYVDRLPDEARVSSHQLAVGSIVHDVIKHFFNLGGPATVNRDEIIAILMRKWDHRHFLTQEISVDEFEKARDMLEVFHASPYPNASAKVLLSETMVRWSRPRRGAVLKGKIDRAILHEDGTLEVIDYKTSSYLPTVEQLKSDLQAIVYRTLAADRFGGLNPSKILITFYYLPISQPVTIEFSKEEFAFSWETVEKLINLIRRSRDSYSRGEALSEAFPRYEGTHCSSCPLRSHCGSQQKAIAA